MVAGLAHSAPVRVMALGVGVVMTTEDDLDIFGLPPLHYYRSSDAQPGPVEPKPLPSWPARYELRGAERRTPGDPPGGVFDDSLDGLVQSVAHNRGMIWHVLDTKTGEVVAHSDGWGQIGEPHD